MKDKDYAEPYPCGEICISKEDALKTQISGSHYKRLAYQPVEFIEKVNMHYCCANILKYVVRFKNKNGCTDLNKALHYCDLLEATGGHWWDGIDRISSDDNIIDGAFAEFFKFIKDNNDSLDECQIKVVIAIMNYDMDFLKSNINKLITNNYGKD